MKHLIFIALCVAGGAFGARFRPQPAAISKPIKVSEPQVVDGRQLPLAEPCDPQRCAAPHCRCSQHSLDFDKTPIDKVPQLVMLTFDDAVTALNAPMFEEAIAGRTNPDGCPVAATFYVSHEYTDYSMVHNLWSQGHEIALHSITRDYSSVYWKTASVEKIVEEYAGQREMMSHFGQIPMSDLNGMRLPMFQKSGNASYEALVLAGLTYDSSWTTQEATPVWPYSLEYASVQDCPMGNCPRASIPGAWVVPVVDWFDVEGVSCSMIDTCVNLPEDNVNDLLDWMISNFERVYLKNRAPFGVYTTTSWFQKGEHFFEAYKAFLDHLDSLPDVYMVSNNQVVEFVRNPRAGKPFDKCVAPRQNTCESPKMCALKKQQPKWIEDRYMTSCAACPEVYPWLGNIMGEKRAQDEE